MEVGKIRPGHLLNEARLRQDLTRQGRTKTKRRAVIRESRQRKCLLQAAEVTVILYVSKLNSNKIHIYKKKTRGLVGTTN